MSTIERSDRHKGTIAARRSLFVAPLLALAHCVSSAETETTSAPTLGPAPPPARIVSGEHQGPDGRVHWLRSGDPHAPRILFIHGTPGSATNWNRYLERPPGDWCCVSIDRPGFGDSEPSGHVTSLSQQAAALLPLLVEQRGIKPILVGHSLGGPIVARAAADYPHLVGGIVIASGSVSPDLEELHWYNQLIRPIEALFGRSLRNANRELYEMLDELIELRDALPQVRCPVAIVHGTEDGLVPYANVNYLTETLTAPILLSRLEGAGHLIPWMEEDALRAAIEELQERLSTHPAVRLP